MRNETPQRIGNYELLETLGQGGMATVYKARDPAIGHVVALKVLKPELLSDPTLRDKFAKEARAAGQLDHENIIRIYHFDPGETSGQPFIVTEFIEGESLQKAIARRAPISLARKLQIIIQFCKGLDYAHRHGLVHRDVKPANILVKSDGKVKVMDFRIVHMESTTRTKTGIFMGTIQYASPEQMGGQRADARSDIFSVGIVMYEFLAYRKPFDGTTIGAVINQILNKDPVPLSQVAKGIPPELENAVNKCLRKSADDRFQSLDGLITELERLELKLQQAPAKEPAADGQPRANLSGPVQAQNGLQGPLVFEGFLAQLRRQGFTVGVDHHLRLQQLLAGLGSQCSPRQLKTILCPIFAINQDQQRAFYRSFDDYFSLFLPSPGERAARAGQRGAQQPVEQPSPTSARKWPYVLAASLLLAGVLAWHFHRPPPPAPTPARSAPMSETSSPAPAPLPPENKNTSQWDDRIIPAIGIPLVLFLLYELYLYNTRKLVLQKRRVKKPPYSWPIKLEGSPAAIFDSPPFYSAARHMQRRLTGEACHLDVEDSIRATIDSLGYPRLRYRPNSRVPEYLVLIDRSSFRDHQAHMLHALVNRLRGEGLFITSYYFEGDPRVCYGEDSAAAVYVSELQTRYSQDRLLILGDGEKLIDSVNGKLVAWSALFRDWTDRAVLTPEVPKRWGLREKALASQFIVLPATLEGFLAMVDHFELAVPSDLRGWRQNSADVAPPQPESGSLVEALRNYLGQGAFEWLCACAVYPELHWDLTLHLGSLRSLREKLINEANLVKLVRLPWFRLGSIPDDVRSNLIQQLKPTQERAIREAIIGVLEKNRAPKETHASDARGLEIATQRYWLDPRNRKVRRDLIDALSRTPDSAMARDYTLLSSLESAASSPLDFLLPRRLRRILYPSGLSVFGLKTGARVLATILVILAGVAVVGRLPKRQIEQPPSATAVEPPSPPMVSAGSATVILAAVAHVALTGPFDPNRIYNQSFLDSGFRLQSGPDLSGIRAPSGTILTMLVDVAADGSFAVSRCLVGGQQVCEAVASAPGWKFSTPTVNGNPARAVVMVNVRLQESAGKQQALDLAMNEFQGALSSGNYSGAEAAMQKVSLLGGSEADLHKKIEDKYNRELSGLKAQAADAAGNADTLQSVLRKVDDLAARSGSRGLSARNFAGKLQNQIARLNTPTQATSPSIAPLGPCPGSAGYLFRRGSFQRLATFASLDPMFMLQTISGTIAGCVTGPGGRAIPAVITATDAHTGRSYAAPVRGADGSYKIFEVPPGYYSVKAESSGLQTFVYSNVRVDVNLSTRLDFKLAVAVAGTPAPAPIAEQNPAPMAAADPAKIAAARKLGEFYLNRCEYGNAIAEFQKGLDLDPHNAELRALLERGKSAEEAESRFAGKSGSGDLTLVLINTKPSGLEVFCDCKSIGKSPAKTTLAPGEHPVAVRCPTGDMTLPLVIKAGRAISLRTIVCQE